MPSHKKKVFGSNSFCICYRFHAPALKLFGRLTSHYASESKLWRLYAKLVAGPSPTTAVNDVTVTTAASDVTFTTAASDVRVQATAETSFKAAQLMQKALGSAVQAKDWSKSKESCVETMSLASEAVACKFGKTRAQMFKP